jgi:hypothetical protein
MKPYSMYLNGMSKRFCFDAVDDDDAWNTVKGLNIASLRNRLNGKVIKDFATQIDFTNRLGSYSERAT